MSKKGGENMQKLSFIDKILNSNQIEEANIVEKFLDRIDNILSCYDDFMDEIYSDIFYELYLNEDKKSYLKIAISLNISTSKVYETKRKIEAYAKKLICSNKDFFVLKRYL